MNIVAWRIYYSGGRVFSSLTTPLSSLPTTGVLVIVVYFDREYLPGKPYRGIIYGNDRYYYITSTGDFGQTDESAAALKKRFGNTLRIYEGQLVSQAEFDAAVNAAMAADMP